MMLARTRNASSRAASTVPAAWMLAALSELGWIPPLRRRFGYHVLAPGDPSCQYVEVDAGARPGLSHLVSPETEAVSPSK
jgi:hypothetical protein